MFRSSRTLPGQSSELSLSRPGFKERLGDDRRLRHGVGLVGTKVGSSDTAARPLWVFMHGGGAGYFDASGKPVPGPGQKIEESAASLTTHLTNNGLLGLIRAEWTLRRRREPNLTLERFRSRFPEYADAETTLWTPTLR